MLWFLPLSHSVWGRGVVEGDGREHSKNTQIKGETAPQTSTVI